MGHFDPEDESFEVLEAHEIPNVPDLPSFLFKYTILESNTAIKPFLMQHLLERYELSNLVYFDPDIWIAFLLGSPGRGSRALFGCLNPSSERTDRRWFPPR